MTDQLKIAYIISGISKSIAFEWIEERLRNSEVQLFFVLIGKKDTPLETYLATNQVQYFHLPWRRKIDLIAALVGTIKILRKEKPSVVHTHLFEANLIGLLAARLVGIKRRIHTRHHGTIHHNYFPRAVLYDRIVNRLSTLIIAPSRSIVDVLVELDGCAQSKVRLLHHGFDLGYFRIVSSERVSRLRTKYDLSEKSPIIGVVARFTAWKGVQYIIPSFAGLLDEFPDAHLILANAKGDYQSEIDDLLEMLPEESYTKIQFEEDNAALYHLFDVYVHTPIDDKCEAFGQTYVEALASGIPAVFTLSGVACEFIEHGNNALVANFADIQDICEKIKCLLVDTDYAKKLAVGATHSIDRFDIENHVKKLQSIYLHVVA